MENNNENEEKAIQPKKNNNLVLIVVGLVLIIGVGIVCFFLGQNTANKNTSSSNNKENQESSIDNIENQESNENNEGPKEEPSVQDINYELSKCLNCSNFSSDTTIKTITDNGLDFVKVNVRDDEKTIEIKLLSEIINGYGANIKDRTIVKQLNNEIKQVLVTSYGGDTGLATIHYLMKDGTIKYTKIWDEVLKLDFDNLSDDDLFNTKDFNDIKNIVKIVPVMYEGDLPSYGVIAIQDNGSFYNLNV